jgi:HD-GYP domain-containing protein (c-di-GMP phosphodiesterase class II)
MAMGRFRAGDSSGIDLEYLRSLLRHAGAAVLNTQAFRGLHEQTMRVARTLMSLAAGRDEEDMERDAERTTHYVSAVARMMNFPPEDTLDFIYGTVLHDIGMIEISDLLLRSPSKLTPAEWKLVQRHPVRGAEILRDLDFGEKTCEVVMHHHERFNGEGYPNGLKGNAIPLGTRILAVVESYQAMVRDLPYRAALSRDEAMEVLRENWEMRYDPEVVLAFAQVLATEPHRADVEETLARS